MASANDESIGSDNVISSESNGTDEDDDKAKLFATVCYSSNLVTALPR